MGIPTQDLLFYHESVNPQANLAAILLLATAVSLSALLSYEATYQGNLEQLDFEVSHHLEVSSDLAREALETAKGLQALTSDR